MKIDMKGTGTYSHAKSREEEARLQILLNDKFSLQNFFAISGDAFKGWPEDGLCDRLSKEIVAAPRGTFVDSIGTQSK